MRSLPLAALPIVVCASSGTAFAACTGEEAIALRDRGFSEEQVLEICRSSPAAPVPNRGSEPMPTSPGQEAGAPDPWDGIWLLSTSEGDMAGLQFAFAFDAGSKIVDFEPKPEDQGPRFEDPYGGASFKVTDVRFDGSQLYFAVRDGPYSTLEYVLGMVGPERLEGQYRFSDTYLSDTGAIEGPEIPDIGRATAIKTGCTRSAGLAECLEQARMGIGGLSPPMTTPMPAPAPSSGGGGYGSPTDDRAQQMILEDIRRRGRQTCRMMCNPYGVPPEVHDECLRNCDM